MKYGAHIYIWTDRWSDHTLHILDRAARLGLDCLEIAIGDDVIFSPGLTAERARSLGIELILSPGGHWPPEADLSDPDPANRVMGCEWHRKWIDVAGEMGAVAYSGALYGHTGTVRRVRPDSDEFPRTSEGLHWLAEHARRTGVKLVLEPMSHFRTHLVNTPAQMMRLVNMVNHENIGVQLDTYHMITEVRDYAEAVRTVGDKLWGVHACESDRGVPGGGLMPWKALFGALREISFNGRIMFEAYNSSLGDFAYTRGMFHDVCPDGDEFVRQGVEFARKHLPTS